MNSYYVYLHRRADNGEVFYVGKGRGNRATNSVGRNADWWNIVNRYGFVVEYAAKGLSDMDAKVIEACLIAEHLERDSPLVNKNTLLTKRVVRHKGVVDGTDVYYKWKNVAVPGITFATASAMVVDQGCNPLELSELLDGKIAITTDGWYSGEQA